VIYPPGLGITPLSSLYQCTRGGYVPDPERSGWLKYDKEKDIKILTGSTKTSASHAVADNRTRHLVPSVKD
jgi:hypothetical protein